MTSTHYDSLTGYLQIRCGTFTLTMCESVDKCCLHSFYYIFLFTFTPTTSIPYRGQKANWLYQERKLPGTFAPGNKSSRKHSFPEAKVPGNFCSWEWRFPLGTFALRSENTGEWKVLIPFKLRRNFFSQRVVSHWNKLPTHVVEADTVNSFKNWLDQELAGQGTGHLKLMNFSAHQQQT